MDGLRSLAGESSDVRLSSVTSVPHCQAVIPLPEIPLRGNAEDQMPWAQEGIAHPDEVLVVT